MADFDPIKATGVVSMTNADGGRAWLGSATAFRQPHVFLTAAHCIRGIPADRMTVQLPTREEERPVTEVRVHPSGDVAVLYTPADEGDDLIGYPRDAFWNCVGNVDLAEDFVAFGYPVEGPWQDLVPVARAFKGHFQRFFRFESPDGAHTYEAGELSISAPAGLSGGPLFRPGALQMLTGIVTANLESSTAIDSREDGPHGPIETRRVISYGLCLMLHDVEGWLNEHVPHRVGTSWRLP